MDVDFCIAALEEAMARHGRPEIFNTDQGSQFTSPRFTEVLTDAGVRISMDGRGRWMDNGSPPAAAVCPKMRSAGKSVPYGMRKGHFGVRDSVGR